MFPISFRWGGSVLVLLLMLGPTFGQGDDYRQFLKPPETAEEFWAALKYELSVGRPDLAAKHLEGFMSAPPKDKDKTREQLLLDIEKKEGMSSFLQLRNVPRWSEDPKIDKATRKTAEDLIEQVSTAVEKILGDPDRIRKLVAALTASPAEKSYAISELRRSGARAIPEIVHVLHEFVGQPGQPAVASALPRLRDDTVPPLLAALDTEDQVVKQEIIDALANRDSLRQLTLSPALDPRPYLYFVAASPRNTDPVRKRAREALSLFEGMRIEGVPNARTELVSLAERYHYHRIRFTNPDGVTVWRWNGSALTMSVMNATQAEEYYGLYFARKSLDLDPAYDRAQVAFLSIAVDKAMEQAGPDKSLAEAAPKVRELIATVNPQLAITALDQALRDRRTPLALGLVRALGDQGDVKAVRPMDQGLSVLVKAMSYPDRRVQYAAADSMLRIGGPPAPQGSGRVVEVLRRNATLDLVPKVLVADANRLRADAIATVIKGVGFEAVVVQTGRQLTDRLREAGDIDLVLIDHEIFAPQIEDLLAHLRSDVDWSAVPLVITVPTTSARVRQAESALRLQRLASSYRNVTVMPATLDPDVLKPLLPQKVAEAMGAPYSAEERKRQLTASVEWLRKLAVGEVPGYDVRPAESALAQAMRSPDVELARAAVLAGGRIATRSMQRELAALVLSDQAPAPIRAVAAAELNRSMQQMGNALLKQQLTALSTLYRASDDAALKSNLVLVFGSVRPDAAQTGARLKRYEPAAPAVAPMPQEKKEDKEK